MEKEIHVEDIFGNLHNCSSDASQTIMIVGDGQIELVKDVNLA